MTSPPPSSSPSTSALARTTPASLSAPAPPVDISSGVFSGIAAFEAAQRMAQSLCTSSMVPTEYRGQQGLSNSLIALEIAARMGLSPLVVMQNMTPIHGRPTWSSSFLIATVNASGRFTPLRFVFDDKANPSSCYAVASDKASGEVLEGETISIAMAKREGWWSRPDRNGKETSKWQSMTGQMLRYRAAAFWVKVYCPEISLGLMTQDEAADVQAVVVDAVQPAPAPAPAPGPGAAAVPTPLPARQPAQQPAAAATKPDHDGTPQATAAPAAPVARRSSKRSAAAQKQSQPAAETDHDGLQPPEAGQSQGTSPQPASPEGPAAPGPGESTHQPELPTGPTPQPGAGASEPSEPSSTQQPSSAELLSTAQQEIPRLASAAALDNAHQRVNRLLAEGQLSDEAAERLWSLIDRRRQQLQASGVEGQP
ncbi:hypothetical protein KBY96_14320 [Cyanobium sp. ATX 6A2]|uniref:hypothetical protein n=1 Tax=Cyanobium sp. ATX 6A2 TaxID=2823700 RepID=UPI0020CE64C9|nr:hypothetical protein [Cyanobium sp. ATX 6A2]MCP9889098.1 hypothetical protein [Cyanobium sp. ATX 6A2]